MALLNYPVPDLEVTLQEVGRVLQLILGPEKYTQYKDALCQQKEVLQDVHHRFAAAASGRDNWVTEQFKNRLLSCPCPLPTSTAMPAVLLPSRAERGSGQLKRAAALLWAAAKLHSEPWLLEGDGATERTQQSEVFAASRLPGKTEDQLKVYPDSLHAIVLCTGGIFPIQILHRPSPGSPLSPLPFLDIYSQVQEMASQPAAGPDQDPTPICSLSALQRQAWSALREQILQQGGTAAESLGLMESAVLAVCLEDCCPPADLAETLNAVRLGGGDGQCLRYYDKVVNLVVFKNSTAGMVFEHCALDGMVAGLVAESVWHLSESLNLDPCQPHGQTTASPAAKNISSSPLKPLNFPLKAITMPAPAALGLALQATHPIITFEFFSYPDIFTTLRGHRGLFDAWITFSLQLALKQTLGDSAAGLILVTPTHMRHYKHGRCDPTYSFSTQTRQLVEALMSCASEKKDSPQFTKELFSLFHLAFLEHKRLIKITKSGDGVGPHIAALRWGLSEENPVKAFLEPFGSPSIYLTGKDLMEGVECAVGNVYARDQLAVTYLGRRDRVRMLLNGKGSFAKLLKHLQESLKDSLNMVMLLALRYAIAGQMGALECLLQEEEVRVNGKECQTDSNVNSSQNSNFTLLIHGGAGEDILLNQKVIDVVEFSLQTALSLGAQELAGRGSSLDAVQKCVAALEDCFLFNAGKGSVFNRDGKQEMEATIVDGTGMNAGSVACVRNVKNPVKAARQVMEKSGHTLLTGEGAEEFLEGLDMKEKPVEAKYFHTHLRWKEREVMCSSGNASKNNHPQTVGAVALDCWGNLAAATSTAPLQFCPTYPGYISSVNGPSASPEKLREMQTKITQCKPPHSWKSPQDHAALAMKSQWYRNLFQIQNTLFHETVEYFHNICRYAYALTPLTTDTISSPMGLGSDSEPVYVNVMGQNVYLADSMQFVLEYFLRFQEDLPGTYYVSPSFRGEDPDATHLNQFYHVECELLGDMDAAIKVAEGYVAHITRALLKMHSSIILNSAGTLSHVEGLLKKLDNQAPLPQVTLEQAITMMPSEDCFEWVQDGQPQFGRKLTRKGERVLIKKYGSAVWLTEMDHLGVPFYQAYVDGSGKQKAKAADLLLGLGETIGLGERHSTSEMVQEALRHHAVPEDSYKWYLDMRQIAPLLTSGWGMGTERYLCWLLKHDDVRDMHIIPRMKAKKFMP
ncbi:hypothetical protein ANANG_G00292160 [Anguilla anguilla]|uniref:Aminoacyl-transfer RNA synthetases class-II family profile domain-containing protein n=1 Tax=Anguilla anguilla TaxID=7936 RepID=A0A9D3LQ09_ANGAN|nr:hypothetical protein ANANG_G00292160 [Anguilla anguilla]